MAVDEITVSSTAATTTPNLAVSKTNITGLDYFTGSGPSASGTYNLSGSNLTGFPGNIAVAAPTNFEVSTDNTTFTASVNVAYTSATLVSTPIYVRLKSGLAGSAGGTAYTGSVSQSGGGVTTSPTVSVSGTVTNPVTPVVTTTTPATGITTTTATLGGTITTLGAPAPTANGVVFSALVATPILTSGTVVAATPTATGAVPYTVSATGLTANMLYNYQAYVTNANGTVYGGVQQFTTLATISSTTDTAPTSTTAAPGGTSGGGAAALTEQGVYYSTTSNFTVTGTTPKAVSASTAVGAFTTSLTGLTPGTTYYVKAYVTNAGGTNVATQVSFTTPGIAPVVTTTNPPSVIGQTTATLGGNITTLGTPAPTANGIVYSATIATPILGSGTTRAASPTATATGVYTVAVTGLTANTVYNYQAYVTNSNPGTSYGGVVSFTTLAGIASTTDSNPGTTTAAPGGTSSGGTATLLAQGVEYSTTAGFANGTGTPVASASTAVGAFTANLTGLTPGTVYYAKAYVTNAGGTNYGAQVTFTTSIVPTLTTTSPATIITSTGATLSGNISSFGTPTGSAPAYGFVYSLTATNATPTIGGTGVMVVTTGTAAFTGSYSSAITGLTASSGYSFQAYATNSAGTTYGGVVAFTTSAPPTASLTASPTSLALGTTAVNTPGSIFTYTLTGSGTTGAVTIVPPANVEISTDGFATTANSSTTSLTVSEAAVTATAGVTVSVRIASTAAATTISGNVANTGTNAATANVAVTGTVGGGTSTCTSNGFESANGTFPGTGYTASSSTDVVSNSNSNTGSVAAAFGPIGGYLTFPAVSGASVVSFAFARSSSTTARGIDIQASTDGTTFTTVASYSSSLLTANNTYVTNTYTVGSPYNSGTVYFRLAKTGAAALLYVDDIVVTCGAATPALTVATGTISPAGPYCVGQSTAGDIPVSVPYTVSGGSFGAGNVLTAFLSNDNFVSNRLAIGTATAVAGSGTIAAKITQVTGLTTGTYRIRVEGSTTSTATYTNNGTDLAITSYLTNEVATATATPGNGQATLAFTGPASCATNVVVTIRVGSTLGSKPTAGGTYTASTTFGSGTAVVAGQYVVYNGPATGSVTVTGLTNDTQYAFGIFVTNGGATGTTGYSNGTLRAVTPVVPGTLTEVLVPQYISGRPATGSTHTTRLPYAWRATLGSLKPNTTYKYYAAARAATDAANYTGVGIPIDVRAAGSFVRQSGPTLTNASYTLTTDASGSYTGWFAMEPSEDSRFIDQSVVYPLVVLNNGDGSNVQTQFLAATSPVTAVLLASGATQATGLRGNSFGTPSNFVLTYDNVGGTGRPLAGTFVESDGSANTTNYATFYSSNVNGINGAYGLLTPNSSALGTRRVEQRALADGTLVGCVATSATGTWLGGAVTSSPTGGNTTILVLTTGDTPFAAPTTPSFSATSIQNGQTLTVTGTNFSASPNATVTFTGSTTAVAATVNAAGTSLTVVVPAGATTGPITVSNSCGTSPASGTLTVVQSVFYTVTGATDLSLLSSFTTNSDGSPGPQPTDFALNGQTFNVLGTGRTFASNWVVGPTTGTNTSRVVITSGAELVIPTSATLRGYLNQAANSTLTILNSGSAAITGIVQDVQDVTSTINLAQGGNVYLVPTTLTYQNLKLTNGAKRIAGDNGSPLVVARNLTFDNTQISGSTLNASAIAPGDYSTFYFGGDFTQLNNTTYDGTRNVVFQPANTTTVQNLNANGGTISLYDVFSSGSTEKGFRLTGTGSVLQVGNIYDGGFALNGANTSLALDAGTTLRFFPGGAARFFFDALGQLKPDPASNIEINRGTAGFDVVGYLPIADGFNSVNNLTINLLTGYNNSLSIENNLAVTGTLALQSGTLDLNAYTLSISGNLTGTGSLSAGSSNTASSSASNLVVNGTGTLATLNFLSGYQNISSLTMNRAGSTLTLGTPLTAKGTLTLTDGLIATTATNLLTVTRAGSVTASTSLSATSYINGPLARGTAAGARTTLFPIGNGAIYRPLTLTATAQTAVSNYTATQIEASAGGTSGVDAPLTRVSTVRYFTVTSSNTTAGNFTGTITLSFGPDDFVNTPNDPTLVIAKRDVPANWKSIGHGGETGGSGSGSGGNPVSGTLTSASFSNFSDFTLGSTNPDTRSNPLPVELTAFAAHRSGSAVAVNWATASEKNSRKFVVERSLDGSTFAPVAEVAAAGTSLTPLSYATTDATAPSVALYYRLQQVDFDGTKAYSKVVALSGTAAELSLVPNPARESVQLFTSQGTTYTMRSLLGQVVRTGTTEAGATTISLTGLPTGVYTVELTTAAGRVVRKLVKE